MLGQQFSDVSGFLELLEECIQVCVVRRDLALLQYTWYGDLSELFMRGGELVELQCFPDDLRDLRDLGLYHSGCDIRWDHRGRTWYTFGHDAVSPDGVQCPVLLYDGTVTLRRKVVLIGEG